MPSRRITMRKIKEVLRLRYTCGLSLEQIARAQNLSKGVVAKYLKRAAAAGIDGAIAQVLSEADLVERLKPSLTFRTSRTQLGANFPLLFF